MMSEIASIQLSEAGVAFLHDPVMHEALSVIAASVGITPKEYLLRFEEVLSKKPQAGHFIPQVP